jgi:hypothetical protein
VARAPTDVGVAAVADSAFDAALSKLPTPGARDPHRHHARASDADTAAYHASLNSGDRARFLTTFWKSRDPDLTTPYNEVRLEMLARGVVGYFLYYDAKHRTWDDAASTSCATACPTSSSTTRP